MSGLTITTGIPNCQSDNFIIFVHFTDTFAVHSKTQSLETSTTS